MLSRLLRRRPSPAMAVALAALFVALGGTSYAALVITGKNVKNNSLTGADIKSLKGGDVSNNSLTGADVKNLKGGDISNGTITSNDVLDNSLTGDDIDESKLGKVPTAANSDGATNANHATNADHATTADSATNANHATSADSTDGANFATVSYSSSSNTPATILNNFGGLTLKASCVLGNLSLTATTATSNAKVSVGRAAAATTYANDGDFDTADTFTVDGTNNDQLNLNYRTTPTSVLFPRSHVSVQLLTQSTGGIGGTCTVDGHAIQSSTGGLIVAFPKNKKK